MLVYRCYNSVHLYHISHDDDEKAQIYFIQENFFSKELQVNIPEETVQRCLDQIAFGKKKIPLKFMDINIEFNVHMCLPRKFHCQSCFPECFGYAQKTTIIQNNWLYRKNK